MYGPINPKDAVHVGGRESFSQRAISHRVPNPANRIAFHFTCRPTSSVTPTTRARTFREEAARDVDTLFRRATATLLDQAGWLKMALGEVLKEPPRNGLSPKSEVESGGRAMLRINAVSSSPTRFVDVGAVKHVEVSDTEARRFVLQHDDVLIVRYNGDINRVAKAAIYKESGASHVVFPDKLMRLRPDLSKMLPDFLVFALSARTVREQIEQLGKTTAGNIGISGANAKSFVVPVPPISDQLRRYPTGQG